MNEFLKIRPSKALENTTIFIPSSKPETQRSIITAALAEGVSTIHRDLRCSETFTTKKAIQSIGAIITEHDDYIKIKGVGNNPIFKEEVINCNGSGFAFRTMCVISSFISGSVVITGDSVLQNRIMSPLLKAINQLGGNISSVNTEGKAPIVNYGNELSKGKCTIPGNTCSQFTTALLLGLPLSNVKTELNISGKIASASYIKQTIEAMKTAGVELNEIDPSNKYIIEPSRYKSFTSTMGCDFTSASYILAISALFKGDVILSGMTRNSYQGERIILDFIEKLGIHIDFDDEKRLCYLHNHTGKLCGDYVVDVQDCPNILPTLAAIGSYIDGSLIVTGGSVTNHHKSPRIKSMVCELKKMGVDITPIHKDSVLDGFIVKGKRIYEGGIKLSSHGDHRIFLSLFIASLRTKNCNFIYGHNDVHCSFPDFFSQVEKLGLIFENGDDIYHGWK